MPLFPGNPYPGRGLAVGLNDGGDQAVVVYWLMGRSPSSQARRMTAVGDDVLVGPTGEPDPEHPALIYYRAFARVGERFVISNGDQTDTIVDGLHAGASFETALAARAHEPDEPHFTSRVSALVDLTDGATHLTLSRISAAPGDPARSVHETFAFEECPAGSSYGLHTYAGDGNPLPPMTGAPIRVPLHGDLDAIADFVWAELAGPFRVALAVIGIDRATLAVDRRFRHATD